VLVFHLPATILKVRHLVIDSSCQSTFAGKADASSFLPKLVAIVCEIFAFRFGAMFQGFDV